MTSAPVWINGVWAERGDARVGAFDAGLQHGVGLFETMLGEVGPGGASVRRLEAHLDRLATSAAELGLAETLRTGPLADAVVACVERAGHERCRVRLTVTGGDLNMLESAGRTQHDPTIVISALPATTYPAALFERGVAVTIADAKANPLNPFEGHKTVNYWWRLRELQRAAARGGGESIVLQVSNHLCGGCVSNVFVVRDGTLLTPIARGEEREVGGVGAIPSPVLPGVTRGAVMEAANARGVGVGRQMLSVNDLLDADEVFLTNSSFGVLPVVKVEAEAIGDGVPGAITRELMGAMG